MADGPFHARGSRGRDGRCGAGSSASLGRAEHDHRRRPARGRVLRGQRRGPLACRELRRRLPKPGSVGRPLSRGRPPRPGRPGRSGRRSLGLSPREAADGVARRGRRRRRSGGVDREALLVRRSGPSSRPAFRHRQLHRRRSVGRAGDRARGRHAGALVPLRRGHGGLALDDARRRPTGQSLQRGLGACRDGR